MKSAIKSKLSAALALIFAASLAGCSEGAYTPSAQNANVNPGTYYGPNGVPTNNLTPIPQPYPNYPMQPMQPQIACQPVLPNCANILPNVCAQLTFQAQFLARQRCPSVVRCNPTQNLTPVSSNCRIQKNSCLKKKVVKRCSTCVPQYVITSTCENRDDDRRLPPVYSVNDDRTNSKPSNTIPTGEDKPSSNTTNDSPVANNNTIPTTPTTEKPTENNDDGRLNNDHTASVSEENKVDDSRFIPISGRDAKELYERLDRVPYEGTDAKGRTLVKVGTHLKCTVTHPKQLKEQNMKKKDAEYNCWVSVAIEDGSALDYDFGVSDSANGKETLKSPKLYEGDELNIGTRGTSDPTTGIIVISGADAEHMYDGMTKVQPKENQYLNEAKDSVGTVKLGSHSRCYQATSSVGKPTRCVYKLDTIKGELLKAEDLGEASDKNNTDNQANQKPADQTVNAAKEDVQQDQKQDAKQDPLLTQGKDQQPTQPAEEKQPLPLVSKPTAEEKQPEVKTEEPKPAPVTDAADQLAGVDQLDNNAANELNQPTADQGNGKGTETSKGQKVRTKDKIKDAFTPKKKKNKSNK